MKHFKSNVYIVKRDRYNLEKLIFFFLLNLNKLLLHLGKVPKDGI